ncbi:MAG: hypothetical protein NTZ33_04980 [Bacteroidetes bacterium]|nr:hypothetical protein [Bacteroidota bacterium]
MRKYLILLFVFLVFPYCINAQFYDAGQDPASVKWKQINTNHFQLIFPEEFSIQANILANNLETAYEFNTISLSRKPVRIPIILHNRNVVSNGFVTWAPRRSEWFTCPPQDGYSQPWLQQLSLHEYRHVIQVSQMYTGFTNILRIPFGELATGSIAGIYLPRWFLEGDAVVQETALSTSGRGRLPAFSMDLKAQLFEKGKYNYNKAVFGSYKDYIPDPYTLGYHLVGFSRYKYGADIWDKTLKNIARNPYTVVPFAHGIKKASGKNTVGIYKETLDFFDSIWKKQILPDADYKYQTINTRKNKGYTNYRFPNFINDSEMVALKYGMDNIPCIVKLSKSGKECKVFTQGHDFYQSLSFSKDIIVWSEEIPGLRWDHESYAVIKTYNLKTKKCKTLSKKSRYFAPNISHDASKIAAIEVSNTNDCALVILDAADGKLMHKIASPQHAFLSTPSWSDNDQCIIMTATIENEKKFVEYNLTQNNFNYKTPTIHREISGAAYFKNFIIYNETIEGIDNIYAFDTNSLKVYRLTSAKYGTTDPCISFNEKQLVFADYTANGYDIAISPLHPENWTAINITQPNDFKLYDELARQEKGVVNFTAKENKQYEITKYHKAGHLFNFHSWAPLSIDASNQTAATGISFMSHNALSTSFLTVGYEYITAEKTGKYYVNYTYKGLFPIIDITADYRKSKGTLIINNSIFKPFTFDECNVKIGVRIPLSFPTAKYYTRFQPSISTTLIGVMHDASTPDNIIKGTINTIDYRLYFSHYLRMSVKDLEPKWGQSLDINFRHSPFGIIDYGNIASVETYLYFPSIINHHGFKVYLGVQKRDTVVNRYYFSDLINYPIGSIAVHSDALYSGSIKYFFPLLCPDLSISSLLYVKRLDMNVFYGKADAVYKNYNFFQQSIGGEINSEMHILRFVAPINLGYRFTYLPDNKSLVNEILFGINFSAIAGSRKTNFH